MVPPVDRLLRAAFTAPSEKKQACRTDIPGYISFIETVLSTMSLRWHYPNQVLRSGLTARSQPARAGSLLVFFIILALDELQDK